MVLVLQMVETVIKLAANWAHEEETLAAQYDPTDLGFALEREAQSAYIRADRPAHAELKQHLETLPDDAISELQTLMLAGREGDPQLLQQAGSSEVPRIKTQHQLLAKLPLSRHLENGLALAKVEEAFPVVDEP